MATKVVSIRVMTEQIDEFKRREVERSFRKFSDMVDDLMSSQHQTWPDCFNRLITHCESDPVMQVITEPLKTISHLDAEKWWNDAISSKQSMAGCGSYTLPTDDDERTALLYKVFLMIHNHCSKIKTFCMRIYGHTYYQDMVDTFNRELVLKFTREMSYRLQEIAEDTKDQEVINRESMIVFNHHDHSTTIAGPIQGSIIATNNAHVINSTAQYDTPEDFAGGVRSLMTFASEYSETIQRVVSESLETLATSIESGDEYSDEIEDQLNTLSQISPPISSRIQAILTGAAGNLLSSGIIQGMIAYYG